MRERHYQNWIESLTIPRMSKKATDLAESNGATPIAGA